MTASRLRTDVSTEEERGPMDRLIGGLADALGTSIGFAAEHGILLAVFLVLWLAFGAALVLSHGSLDAAWSAIRSLPLAVQGLLWLLFLPVMLGLWIWESTWPLVLRIVLVGGVAAWNLLVLMPRALLARP